MERVKKILLILFFFACNRLAAQTVVSMEYFWDTDPGTGLGTVVSITTPAIVTNQNFSAVTTGLTTGIHYLYFRTKDSNGKYSLSEGLAVTIVPSIVAAEYFWDNDPGVGLGTSMTVTGAPFDSAAFSPVFSTTGLSTGNHILFVRTKSNTGKWSLGEGRNVTVVSSIIAAEYFWDTDPGNGLGTSIGVTLADSVNFSPVYSTAGLSPGAHVLYVRTKDHTGKWSLTEARAVTIIPSIVAAEYFWDNDPGTGLANSIAVSGAPKDSLSFFSNYPTTGLSPGTHTLYVRTKDNFGKWALGEGRTITIVASVASAEYFWDNDPGLGLGTVIPVASPSDSLNLSPQYSTTGLSTGTHTLYMRTKDNFGRWSLSEARTITIIPAIVAAEYFWDTDPGTGLATAITLSGGPSDSATLNPLFATTGLGIGDHQLFVRTKDQTGKWSISEGRTVTISPGALSLKVFLEGLYAGNQQMQPTLYTTGLSADPGASDSLTVNLFSPANLNVPACTRKAILRNDGSATFYFPSDVLGGSYYVVLRHRNSLETWSKNPWVFDRTVMSIDFTR